MIPKGGRFAKSVVNFVHKTPQNWEKFQSAIQQIEGLLKGGKVKLDGKQKTIFESNKNILKNHEKVQKSVFKNPSYKSTEFPPFNVSKEDFTKGWKPTLVERSNLRNVYKKLEPPERLYTKEMEKIDDELDALAFGGEKYEGLSSAEKATIFKKLQTEMQKLIKIAKDNDPTKLSLSQINKKSHDIQKRIREIADNPDIKGTVLEGPKRDMIKVIAEERTPLNEARKALTKRNSELKYGKKYPVLDPENESFVVIGLDEFGHPIKMSRFTGKFSATKDKTTGELTSAEGTSFYDKWNSKTGKLRKEGEEVFHETLNREGKVIMSNPEYKLPKIQNLEIRNEFYTNLSTSDLAKKGYSLKQIDMIRKGREARKYLEKTENPDHNIAMHEQTSSNEIGAVIEDLYNRGDDIYKMTMKEWVTKIPEYFAEGGQVPGFATGGVSNLFRQRQGFRAGTAIELVKGARWVIRMLKELADDMIFGREQFAKMAEPEKIKLFKETQSAIKHLESGGPIPENLIQNLRQDARFKDLTVSKGGDKDFIEIQEVVLGKTTKGTVVEEIDLMAFKKELPADIIANLNKLPVEDQTSLLTRMKKAFDAAKKGNIDKGVDVLQEQLLTDFIPKGKPHATGGLIDGYATGGVSNLFRSR